MALSPNYGWAEPDNSSLVKNGAQDIRALGDAIDTSLWNVGYGQAAKNKILNGDFTINQRSFSSSTLTDVFTFDRWNKASGAGGTSTVSSQSFTAGTAPVSGYEGSTFIRLVSASQSATSDFTQCSQKIENVRTFAGQTVTYSFWAKAASGTPKIALELRQNFGSGGSPSSIVQTYAGQVTISTSWARYSISVAVPSLTGKTVGTTTNTSFLQPVMWLSAGSDYNSLTGSIGIQNNTIDIWGVQLEYGSKMTPFQTATGTIQGELAACQRYYYRTTAGNLYSPFAPGCANGATSGRYVFPFAVTMRVKPTALEYSTLAIAIPGSAVYAVSSLTLEDATNNAVNLLTANSNSGLSNGAFTALLSNNSTSGYIGVSSEL
jgi:hypothetical protein